MTGRTLALMCLLFIFCPVCIANAQDLNVSGTEEPIELSEDNTADVQAGDMQDDSDEIIKNYTAKDNFGGWKFGADLLFGKGRCDDRLCLGHGGDTDGQATLFAVKGQFQISYMWGENVFFGPVITGFAGYPSIVGGDIRLKLVIPVGRSNKDAVSASAGWGAQWREKIIPETVWDEQYVERNHMHDGYANDLVEYGYNYIPIEMTYEHVFDNRFILGVSAQLNITISARYYVLPYDLSYNQDLGYKYIPVLDMLGLGVHLGYKF